VTPVVTRKGWAQEGWFVNPHGAGGKATRSSKELLQLFRAQRRSAANAGLHVTEVGKTFSKMQVASGLWGVACAAFRSVRPSKGGQE
jgi:hypothetical protein